MSADGGSLRIPLIGAGSIATAAAATPSPSRRWTIETAERVADEDRLRVQGVDELGVVVDDVVDAVRGDSLGMVPRLLDRLGVARPARRLRRVTGFLEELDPFPHESACSQSP